MKYTGDEVEDKTGLGNEALLFRSLKLLLMFSGRLWVVMKTFGSELCRRTACFCRRRGVFFLKNTGFPVIFFDILFKLKRSIEGN